jgi:nitrogen fixation/metabolism regulation signal transduction histidine kinase
MKAQEGLQDSGLRDNGLAERLLHAGIVTLDEAQRCASASPDACRLLGAKDEAALRADWGSIHAQLGLAELSRRSAHDPPLCRRVDLRTARGVRPLRFEVHAMAGRDGVRGVILLRERTPLGRGDRALLLASETHANRHLLSGLVHEAKGPLNNFSLTLALLASSLARIESPDGIPEAVRARWQRYLDLLHAETARIADCLNDIHALAQADGVADERVDVAAALRGVARALRHEAAMREVAIELELPAAPVWVVADHRQLRLALLGITTCLLEASEAGGIVAWRLPAPASESDPLLRIHTTKAALPPALIADLFRISATTDSDHVAAIAARTIIEAHGGDVTLDDAASPPAGLVMRLRRAASPIDPT